jgi:hypothetical protein
MTSVRAVTPLRSETGHRRLPQTHLDDLPDEHRVVLLAIGRHLAVGRAEPGADAVADDVGGSTDHRLEELDSCPG